MKSTIEVTNEMKDKGYVAVHSALMLDMQHLPPSVTAKITLSVGRAARALRALNATAIVRKSITVEQPVIGGKKIKVLTLWTTTDGLAQLEVVVLAANIIAKCLSKTDRFLFAHVARELATDPLSFSELRAAHALDAPEASLEALLWHTRCILVETYGAKP